jgi:hypothetical protein
MHLIDILLRHFTFLPTLYIESFNNGINVIVIFVKYRD